MTYRNNSYMYVCTGISFMVRWADIQIGTQPPGMGKMDAKEKSYYLKI